ncbi:DnaD domain protein [Thermoguttaceae bacterium LCP21S3_D4]|nr:DnaD domain protein [Lachnospiraceae bacterium]MDD6304843.1 DnaD domain protein [Lachnospiraceae bacterium]
MTDITLHTKSKSMVTCVSNTFIDEYMADANGEFVKIYLYLLRCINTAESFSVSRMADKFDHTEKDIKRALKYWEKKHLLQLEYNSKEQLTGICLCEPVSAVAEASEQVMKSKAADEAHPVSAIDGTNATMHTTSVTVSAPSKEVPADTTASAVKAASAAVSTVDIRPSYTKDQILSFQNDEASSDLLFIIERYIGHPLSIKDYETILYWSDELKFSADLIEYLVESCVDNGHKSIRYMDKIALSWSASSIRTVEDARRSSSAYKQTHYGVMKAFGISGRKLAEYELELVDKWTSQFGFTLDIISEACKRTLQATNQPSFQYADTILENWHKCNIHHLDDIAVLDSAYKKSKASASRNVTVNKTAANRFNNFSQRTYNFEQLEKQLLNN